MTLRSFVGRLLLLPLVLENLFLLAFGLSGATVWFTGEFIELKTSDPWGQLLSSLLTFSHRVSLTFLILGGLALSVSWINSGVLAVPPWTREEDSRPWYFLVAAVLTLHGGLAIGFTYQCLPQFQENVAILQGWGFREALQSGGELSSLSLIPVVTILLASFLSALTGLAFITGAFASLGYLLLELDDYFRVLLRGVCLQIAFLLSLYFTLTLFDSSTHFVTEQFMDVGVLRWKAPVLLWLATQTDALASTVWRFTCLLPGFLLCGAGSLWKARQVEWKGQETIMRFEQEVSTAEPTPIQLSGTFSETDKSFEAGDYLIKYRFLSNPCCKVFDIYDPENKLVFIARMYSMSLLNRTIKVHAARNEAGQILVISGRRFLRFPNIFNVTHCPTNKKVGVLKRSVTGWVITDKCGRIVATMKPERAVPGFEEFQLVVDQGSACRYTIQNLIRPIIRVRFDEDSLAVFDRKLGISLALVLGFHSVVFNFSSDDSGSSTSCN